MTLDPALIWLIAGAAMIALEVFLAPGIGMLFGGLAAILTGALVMLGLVPPDQFTWQFGVWFVISGALAMILWGPMKRLRVNDKADGKFNNIIGSHAKIINAPIRAGETGQVSWSGTIMNACIEAGLTELPAETQVIITQVDGNIVTIKPV